MSEDVRQTILETVEASLEAQLAAIRRLRGKIATPVKPRPEKRKSNLSIAIDLLIAEGGPLHASEIIRRAHVSFGRRLDRESLVSALTKCVARHDRFTRPAPNTFALLAAAGKEETPAP